MDTSRSAKRAELQAWWFCAALLLLVLSPSLYLLQAPGAGTLRGGLVDPELIAPTILLNLLFVLAVAGLVRWLWLAGLACLPFLVWLPAEAFYLWKFGGPTTAQTVGVIAETDPAEAMSWLGRSGLLAVAAIVLWAIALCAGVVQLRRARLVWAHWTALVFGVLVPMLVLGVCLWGNGRLAKAEIQFDHDDQAWRGVLDESRAGWTETLAMSYPLGLLMRARDYWRQTRLLADLARRGNREPFVAMQTPMARGRQVFVFIVGESLRADHLQLNGYLRATTPRLAQRDVVSFTDYVSVSSSTRASVPTYFTDQVADQLEHQASQPTLLDGLREAGFRTYWLSTQAPFGRFDSPVSVIARRADDVRFINPGDYRQRGVYDQQLLRPLAEVLAKQESRVFIVLHTLGSHADYRYRYPAEHTVFLPVLEAGRMADPWDRRQRVEQINAYDNAVRYTDAFIDDVIGMLERQDAQSWVFYASDHGESLFDGQCAHSGHGFPAQVNHRAAALFWSSSGYAEHHAEKVKQLRARAEVPSDYRAVMPTLLDLADVSSPRIEAASSLASAAYVSGNRRIVPGGAYGVIDFDRDMQRVDCANGNE